MLANYYCASPNKELSIVFPFDKTSKKFDSGFYSPTLTGGRVSLEEINQILSEIDAIRKSIASQAIAALICHFVSLSICSGLFVFTGTPGMITFYIIGLVVAVLTIVGVLMWRILKLKGELKTKCKEVVDKHNQTFMLRGLRWHLPVNFPSWVELWKDYQSQDDTKKGQTQSSPPTRQPYTPASDSNQYQQNYYQDHSLYAPLPQS